MFEQKKKILILRYFLSHQAVGRKMACGEFIENLADLNDGDHFPKELLKGLYQAIKAQPIEWAPYVNLPHTLFTTNGHRT